MLNTDHHQLMRVEQTVLYSDKDSPKMVSVRKRAISRSFWMPPFVLVMFALTYADYRVEHTSPANPLNPVFELTLWTIGVAMAILFFLFIHAQETKTLKNGLTLTTVDLRIYSSNIPVASILRAETIWIPARSTILAVDYIVRRKGEAKVVTRYISEKNAENIYALRNALRRVKGWREQDETPMSTPRKWEKERRRLFPYAGLERPRSP